MTELLLPAFLVSLVLVGIHAWFGLEIIKRGILFTDLAIGQLAALGSALSLLLWDGQWMYALSLGFALLGGLVIGLGSRRERNIEPLIGLLYALGVSGVFLLLSRSPHGMEEVQRLMAYDILFTPLPEIAKTTVLYSLIGVFLAWLRRWKTGPLREVAFFVAFAATVTSSVKIGGVLVVFALLVSPALIALYLRRGLFTAWTVGILLNTLALALSYWGDLPTGYTVVFVQAAAATLTGIGVLLLGKPLLPYATSEAQ